MLKNNQVTIPCTPDNAAEFRALVKAWPQLGTLVTGLQAQGLFPGLRGMRASLTGSFAEQGQGVGALAQAIASQAAQTGVQNETHPQEARHAQV